MVLEDCSVSSLSGPFHSLRHVGPAEGEFLDKRLKAWGF